MGRGRGEERKKVRVRECVRKRETGRGERGRGVTSKARTQMWETPSSQAPEKGKPFVSSGRYFFIRNFERLECVDYVLVAHSFPSADRCRGTLLSLDANGYLRCCGRSGLLWRTDEQCVHCLRISIFTTCYIGKQCVCGGEGGKHTCVNLAHKSCPCRQVPWPGKQHFTGSSIRGLSSQAVLLIGMVRRFTNEAKVHHSFVLQWPFILGNYAFPITQSRSQLFIVTWRGYDCPWLSGHHIAYFIICCTHINVRKTFEDGAQRVDSQEIAEG